MLRKVLRGEVEELNEVAFGARVDGDGLANRRFGARILPEVAVAQSSFTVALAEGQRRSGRARVDAKRAPERFRPSQLLGGEHHGLCADDVELGGSLKIPLSVRLVGRSPEVGSDPKRPLGLELVARRSCWEAERGVSYRSAAAPIGTHLE